jgi:predicted AAA+ superfamily ATPase
MFRPQIVQIKKDLKKKIVLLVGPRQSGKTYLAKEIAKDYQNSLYMNFDNVQDRQIIKNQNWIDKTDLLIFDELHKMDNWKNYLKGVFDTKLIHQSILVTGSARLDIFDRVGDSLAGRYFRHRLLPLSLAEVTQAGEDYAMERFLERGGFPEPFLEESEQDADRWRQQYISSLLSTDIFEYDTLHNLKAMRLVFDLLRTRVGSPVSYQSIARDVGTSSATIKRYIEILEAVYIVFRITPYSKNIARSLLKEPKIYFYDCSLVDGDAGARLENFVAVSLLKEIYAQADQLGIENKLHYLRTKDGLEVDFVIANDKEVKCAIEVKTSDAVPSKAIIGAHEKYEMRALQIVGHLKNEYKTKSVEVLKADKYLQGLSL